MMLRTNLNIDESLTWQIQYCESGSSILLTTKSGFPLIELANIPMQTFEDLFNKMKQEIAAGVMIDPITKKRKGSLS